MARLFFVEDHRCSGKSLAVCNRKIVNIVLTFCQHLCKTRSDDERGIQSVTKNCDITCSYNACSCADGFCECDLCTVVFRDHSRAHMVINYVAYLICRKVFGKELGITRNSSDTVYLYDPCSNSDKNIIWHCVLSLCGAGSAPPA